MADQIRDQIKSGIVVLAVPGDGKVQIVVAVTPDLTSRIKAGQIVKELAPIVGGAGGGRPDFAEAGGKHPEKIDEMLAASQAVDRQTAGEPRGLALQPLGRRPLARPYRPEPYQPIS